MKEREDLEAQLTLLDTRRKKGEITEIRVFGPP
jgi:hypothetical protein